MSHLLELLGRGLEHDLGDLLDRYYWSPASESLQQLHRTAQQHPDWPDVQLKLGLCYLRSMQTAQAMEHLSNACRRKPDYLAGRLALAAAHDAAAQTEQALAHIKLALQLSGAVAPVLFAAGFCLERLQRPTEAAEYYRDAIKADAAFIPARQRLAAVAVAQDALAEAIEQYQALKALQPQQTSTRTALAHLYYRSAQHHKAVEEYEAAIVMEPENWALVDDEVEALVADGQLEEASRRLQTLLDRQGDFADLHVRLADVCSQMGRDHDASSHYAKALELQPDYLEAHVKLGTHHLLLGRWDEAAEQFALASDLNDRLLGNYVGLGVAQLAAGRASEAMGTFELAAAVEPNGTLLLSEMARLQLKAAAARECMPAADKADAESILDGDAESEDLLARQIDRHAAHVQRQGEHADVRYRYGVLLRSQGRLVEARQQFDKAVQINPCYVQALIRLAVTQQELGQIDEAIESYKKVLDIQPQYVDLHYRLGLLYTDRKELQQALQHMEKAAEGSSSAHIRVNLALSLQNMGLMDRSAAAWRSLWQLHQTAEKPR